MKNAVVCMSLLMSLIWSGCGVYSFTGASISPEVKTFSVQYFPNRASLVQPLLSQAITEKIKERFISQTSLRQVERDGDLQFEGYISDYKASPVAIQGTQTAALNRLTISVLVKFTNTKDDKQNFETTFTRYADYDSQKSLSEEEATLIDEINRQLVDDIFNKSVSNW
ncbi:MAG: LptE family protein [Bacteroidetes bacterium]|jgi:outer membrane lipopolysaccharide assembly protein LptE/RlpB|nr:LptE family protein [Bacteroidota bacterium]MBK9318701.1 LptE family protein [Bacteroidota bacterium]MBK9401748.1 LptE family protein [Bacteroidota bacterium]